MFWVWARVQKPAGAELSFRWYLIGWDLFSDSLMVDCVAECVVSGYWLDERPIRNQDWPEGTTCSGSFTDAVLPLRTHSSEGLGCWCTCPCMSLRLCMWGASGLLVRVREWGGEWSLPHTGRVGELREVCACIWVLRIKTVICKQWKTKSSHLIIYSS